MQSEPLIHLVAAARPNFMKVAPLYHALNGADWCRVALVHTGQHYDFNMSATFFADLGLPDPDVHLGVGSGTHAEQTASVMLAYERQLLQEPPAWVVVAGDVNSTLSCTLAAKKLNLRVAHLEAGLRSFDRSMPEEINRLVTDVLADLLWTPSPDADENLRREGIPPERIVRVGNIMIDSFVMLQENIAARATWASVGVEPDCYGVVTLHRPANVDHPDRLASIVDTLVRLSAALPLVFPLHPRTRAKLVEFGLVQRLERAGGMVLLEPQGYTSFMSLVTRARLVLTDSGGVQEETTYLGIPCLTLRETTERPITITEGTNRLVSVESLVACVTEVLDGRWPKGRRPDLWDGRTAQRVAASLRSHLQATT